MRAPLYSEAAYRAHALDSLARGDWHEAYLAAKGWITAGGGAYQLDPWLVYAASALLHGQPRTAVHALDLGLKNWIDEPEEQAVLRWVRGTIVWRHMNDPKTALLDLEAVVGRVPEWLAAQAGRDLPQVRAAAASSRKRSASVKPAPTYAGSGVLAETVASPLGPRRPGDRPAVWDAALALLHSK